MKLFIVSGNDAFASYRNATCSPQLCQKMFHHCYSSVPKGGHAVNHNNSYCTIDGIKESYLDGWFIVEHKWSNLDHLFSKINQPIKLIKILLSLASRYPKTTFWMVGRKKTNNKNDAKDHVKIPLYTTLFATDCLNFNQN